MSVQIIAPHRQYGFKLNKLPTGGTGTGGGGGGAIQPPGWHNLINMKIWGSDGIGDSPQNYGLMQYRNAQAQWLPFSEVNNTGFLFNFKGYLDAATTPISAYIGRDTDRQNPVIETIWRPEKIRLTWEPASTPIYIEVRAGNFFNLAGGNELPYASPLQLDLIWAAFNPSNLLSNVLRDILINAQVGSISLKTLEAFGDNPAYYYRVPGQPDTQRPTGGGGTIQAAPLKQIKFKIDLS